MHRFMLTLIRHGGHTVVELPVSHRPRRWLERRALVYTVRGKDV
jgi:hypothetical protein